MQEKTGKKESSKKGVPESRQALLQIQDWEISEAERQEEAPQKKAIENKCLLS